MSIAKSDVGQRSEPVSAVRLNGHWFLLVAFL